MASKSFKNKIKTALGYNPLHKVTANPDNYSGALKKLVEEKAGQISTDTLPSRKDSKRYNQKIADMEPAYNFLNEGVYKNNPGVTEINDYDGFHSGTPLEYEPYPGSIRAIKKQLKSKNLYKYPRTSGDYRSHQRFVDYLEREGFDLKPGENYDGIGINNVVFACSTTHAYSLVLNAIANENDVILMTAPNYGLFAIMSELSNYHLETIDLSAEDDWFVNPDKLAKRIDEINHDLKKQHAGEAYIPKVAAFLNLNPHNPMGNVITRKNRSILEGIGDVCLEKNVFVIDDLVYRDLTYDLDNLALPMASMPKYFNNTISLFGLSKAYNLAGIRAAVILAPIPVANIIINELHNTMDSMPVLQVAATAGAFNGTNRRYKEWRRYLTPILAEYQYRYQLLRALTYGLNTIKDSKLRAKISRDIQKYGKKEYQNLCAGCKNQITIKVEPQSGFFVVFDFTPLKGKTTPSGKVIANENDLLDFVFAHGGLKYLMGGNIFWPNPDELVGRISFGISRENIVKNMIILNKVVRELNGK